MPMGSISEVIRSEMDATFKMLKEAISRIEGDFWKEIHNNWMYGYTLFHVIEAIDYYTSDSAESRVPLSNVSADSEEKEKQTLLTKDRKFFENYLIKVELKVIKVLGKYCDQDLLENDGFSTRGFKSRLHKLSLVMRHAMVHVGELSKTSRNLKMN